MYIKPNDVPQD